MHVPAAELYIWVVSHDVQLVSELPLHAWHESSHSLQFNAPSYQYPVAHIHESLVSSYVRSSSQIQELVDN